MTISEKRKQLARDLAAIRTTLKRVKPAIVQLKRRLNRNMTNYFLGVWD